MVMPECEGYQAIFDFLQNVIDSEDGEGSIIFNFFSVNFGNAIQK